MEYDLNPLPLTLTATIPEEYLDRFNHVNVMWYTHLFDKSIFEFFRQIGLDEAAMRERDAGSFALESHMRYLAEVLVGDQITIRTRLLGRTEKRFHLLNFMVKQDALAATFEVVGCYVDMKTRRMAPLPGVVASTLDAILAEHQQLAWEPPACGVMRP